MDTRVEIVETLQALRREGLVQGSSGNVSARVDDEIWITRSGVRPEDFTEQDVVRVGIDGTRFSEGRPSTEWRMHLAIYRARPEVGAVVHTHSPYASAVSCLREDLPAFHYMIGAAGGDSIRCAPYATVASPELARSAVEALAGRSACLLANHGTMTVGPNLSSALRLSEEVEHLARMFCVARQVGEPVLLDGPEMEEVLQAFSRYRPDPAAD